MPDDKVEAKAFRCIYCSYGPRDWGHSDAALALVRTKVRRPPKLGTGAAKTYWRKHSHAFVAVE